MDLKRLYIVPIVYTLNTILQLMKFNERYHFNVVLKRKDQSIALIMLMHRLNESSAVDGKPLNKGK